ncbi:MAG: site-specific DNA-methyltransferase, partial [Pyrinomonadaceae bacterium]|nr:site-specific DNA-methyltransferase [Pyrinomonadaceae bacterium]
IRFLTEPNDIVLDIFAGSNTTGYVAENEGRRWLAFEEHLDYLAASSFRFLSKDKSKEEMTAIYDRISVGQMIDFSLSKEKET